MLLFEIFDFRFHVIIDWLFLTCIFVTLAIRHNACVRSVQSRVYIFRILTCSFRSRFFSDYDIIHLDFYWISCSDL